jgi:hypothetical protein
MREVGMVIGESAELDHVGKMPQTVLQFHDVRTV